MGDEPRFSQLADNDGRLRGRHGKYQMVDSEDHAQPPKITNALTNKAAPPFRVSLWTEHRQTFAWTLRRPMSAVALRTLTKMTGTPSSNSAGSRIPNTVAATI